MHGFVTILKIFAVVLVLAILGALIFLLPGYLEKEFPTAAPGTVKPVGTILSENEVIDFQPGQREFNRAIELIALGRLDNAREKLTLIQKLYPNTEHGPEARRILGEINLDRLLSISHMENKKIHTVASGEGYLKIADLNDTTLGCIMYLNGLLETGPLHLGDELIVMPLDFKLVVDLARERIELHHATAASGPSYIKDYLIKKLDIGKFRGRSLKTKISRNMGELKGRPYQSSHPRYRTALKIIGFSLGRSAIQIRPVPVIDDEDPGRGIFLAESDVEELAMLIRIGNEVEVKPAG